MRPASTTIVPYAPTDLTGTKLVERLKELAHLPPEEAADFARDIERARAQLNLPPESPWD